MLSEINFVLAAEYNSRLFPYLYQVWMSVAGGSGTGDLLCSHSLSETKVLACGFQIHPGISI